MTWSFLTDQLVDAVPAPTALLKPRRELAVKPKILYDKAGRKIEISATVSEAVAGAFEKQKALPKEGSLVVVRDIAGARSVSRYHPRILEWLAV